MAGGLRSDLWGPSRTLLQYVRPTTLRVTTNGYAVLVRRADVQQPSGRGRRGVGRAVAVLDRHDPHRIFGTAFLDFLVS